MRRVYTFTLYNFIQQVSVILMKNNKNAYLGQGNYDHTTLDELLIKYLAYFIS